MRLRCTYKDCEVVRHGNGLCSVHYKRSVRGLDMDRGASKTPQERFWEKVNKTSDCWEWMGYKTSKGYGKFNLDGKIVYPHRLAYIWENGSVADDVQVDHACRNSSCVNPQHLRPATQELNLQNRGGANRNSASGVRGVYWYKRGRKWVAQGTLNGTQHHLGYFATVEEAAAVVTEWRREHMPYSIMDQKEAP